MSVLDRIAEGTAGNIRNIGATIDAVGRDLKEDRLLKIANQHRQEDRQLQRDQLDRQNRRQDVADARSAFTFEQQFNAGNALELSSIEDPNQALQVLQRQRAQAESLSISTAAQDEAIQMLQAGDLEGFQRDIRGGIEAAYKQGILKAPSVAPTNIEKLINARDAAVASGDNDRAAVLDAAISKATTRSDGTQLTVDADGNISFSQGGSGSAESLGDAGNLNKKLSDKDATQVQKSREASDAAEPTKQLLQRASELLDGIDTGTFAGVTKGAQSVLADLGVDASKDVAARLTEFDSISKELGAQALQLFGGSDTEKELEVAIRTSPSLDKTEGANRAIIERKMRAIEILQTKPDFEAQWLQKNGSFVNPDKDTGEFFNKSWRRYQAESFGAEKGDKPLPEGMTDNGDGTFTLSDGRIVRRKGS